MSYFSIDTSGWLQQVVHQPSPNFNARPGGVEIDLLVIHNISLPEGEFGTGAIFELFQNRLDCCLPAFRHLMGLQVSAHAVILRDGEIVQCVSFDQRAWHAGVSCFEGVEQCNDYSIGIELEGTDLIPYTEAQYFTLIKLTHSLRCRYPAITVERITGHQHIAPSRKTDPGPAFDWRRYKEALS